jgi:CheY-like chemotaxis protein
MVHLNASPASATANGSSRAATVRILYADDLRELREVARLSFMRDGHQIECYPDAMSALARVTEDSSFDLVITDHHMPGMSGLEFVRQLRRLHFAGKTMVFSSELSPNVTADYQKLGIDRIIYKPVFPSALRRVMAELFDLPVPASTGTASPFSRTPWYRESSR